MSSFRFESALAYAARFHAGQRRKGTRIPYIAHPLAVASIVLEYGGNEDEAIAALLHDVITLIQETENKNYADASGLATKFFDGLRQEVANTPPSGLKSSLQSALSQRDAVTAALAKGDPKAHDLLEQMLVDFSQNVTNPDSGSQSKN